MSGFVFRRTFPPIGNVQIGCVWLSVNNGIVEGQLIGGNNNAMYSFIGTPYFPTIQQGDILLIEHTMKHPFRCGKKFRDAEITWHF